MPEDSEVSMLVEREAVIMDMTMLHLKEGIMKAKVMETLMSTLTNPLPNISQSPILILLNKRNPQVRLWRTPRSFSPAFISVLEKRILMTFSKNTILMSKN